MTEPKGSEPSAMLDADITKADASPKTVNAAAKRGSRTKTARERNSGSLAEKSPKTTRATASRGKKAQAAAKSDPPAADPAVELLAVGAQAPLPEEEPTAPAPRKRRGKANVPADSNDQKQAVPAAAKTKAARSRKTPAAAEIAPEFPEAPAIPARQTDSPPVAPPGVPAAEIPAQAAPAAKNGRKRTARKTEGKATAARKTAARSKAIRESSVDAAPAPEPVPGTEADMAKQASVVDAREPAQDPDTGAADIRQGRRGRKPGKRRAVARPGAEERAETASGKDAFPPAAKEAGAGNAVETQGDSGPFEARAVAAQATGKAAEQPEIPLSPENFGEISIPVSALIPDLDSAGFAEFPSGFHDASPEHFFGETEESPDAEAVTGQEKEGAEKKRRSRGRRGRGRKKNPAQTVESAPVAESGQEKPLSAEAEQEFASVEISAFDEPGDKQKPADKPEAPDRANKARPDETGDEEQAAPARHGRRKMFVSVLPEEQVEVVITEEGLVLEYYVDMLHQAKTKGNIYKGVVHNLDPNLQAAFVNYGAAKNGFLQIDEVHPEYYMVAHEPDKGRKYPPIQKVLKPGQEVLVQVVKEPAGTKGAFLTTYLSIPGRFLVLTPGREQIGVSRKVDNERERARLRELLEGLNPGPGLGVIVRTVSMGASKTNLQRDLQYLKRTWKEVRARGTTEKAPCLIYQEQDLTARAVRDYLTETIGEVWVDDEATAKEVMDIAEALFPRKQNLVRTHKDTGTGLFERFNLQRQLDQIHSREVSLPSGGRLVIDATEALTAIDINSGRSSGKNNFEDMAYRTNMEAARMIPLQLRLRDIGGQVVADFIEMRDKSHWREVEKTLRNGMKIDRARYDVGKIGPFGMLEIVRQRLGSSAISVSTEPCPCCNGTGVRRNMEWQSQHALRDILRALRTAQSQKQETVAYKTDPDLALHLLNHKRGRLLEMEQAHGVRLNIQIERE